MGAKKSGVPNLTLWLTAVTLLIWGVPLLLFPQWLFANIGGSLVPVSPIYSRYAGAFFIGIAFAAMLVLQGKRAPGPLFDLGMVAGGLAAIALAVDWYAGNNPFATWFICAAVANGAIISVLSWRSRA